MPVTATFAQNGSSTVQLEHGSYVVGKMVNQEYHITARVDVYKRQAERHGKEVLYHYNQ